jgi:hypothetical protein
VSGRFEVLAGRRTEDPLSQTTPSVSRTVRCIASESTPHESRRRRSAPPGPKIRTGSAPTHRIDRPWKSAAYRDAILSLGVRSARPASTSSLRRAAPRSHVMPRTIRMTGCQRHAGLNRAALEQCAGRSWGTRSAGRRSPWRGAVVILPTAHPDLVARVGSPAREPHRRSCPSGVTTTWLYPPHVRRCSVRRRPRAENPHRPCRTRTAQALSSAGCQAVRTGWLGHHRTGLPDRRKREPGSNCPAAAT